MDEIISIGSADCPFPFNALRSQAKVVDKTITKPVRRVVQGQKAMSSKVVKDLTGAKTKREGFPILYDRLTGRRWHKDGTDYQLAGYSQCRDQVYFSTVSASGDVTCEGMIFLPMLRALDQFDGDLSSASPIVRDRA